VESYLSEPAEWKGHFWPAGKQDQARPGILSYAPDTGARLNLIGGFDDSKWVPAPGGGQVLTTPTREWAVVHGIVSRKPITLLDCALRQSTGGIFGPEPDEQEISAQQVLLGMHLADESSAAFNGIEIWLENLTLWARDSDIKLTMTVNEGKIRQWDTHVEKTPSRVAHLNGMTAELQRGHLLIHGDTRRSHLNVGTNEISSIYYHSKRPRPLKDWLEMVGLTQDLISLAMDTPCGVLGQTVFPSDQAKGTPDLPARSEVSVYTRELVVAQPDEDAQSLRKALFTLNDGGFGTVLTRWIYVQKRFTTACNMLLGLQYLSSGFLETELTTAVGAAEVFHRKLAKKPPIPADEFAELKRKILDCVPPARRQWADSKLQRNEPSLRERLIDLATTPDSGIMNKLVPNPKAWAMATALARNNIAHRGKTDMDEMHAVVSVTTAVVLLNLMHQLDIPKERLVWALTDNGTLSRAARLSAKYWP
jgi:hypothetical protein